MSSCDQIIIEELSVVIEMPQLLNLVVEMDEQLSVIEIDNCPNDVIEVESVGTVTELHLLQGSVIEIEKQTLILEFPDTVVINNPDIPPSGDIDAVVCTYEADDQIQVNRVVSMLPNGRIKHADKDDDSLSLDVLGVSRQSGAIGQFVEVVKFGRLTGASLGAVSENFFLGNNGQILSSVSPTGNWVQIGMQLSASDFFVNLGEPIRRN